MKIGTVNNRRWELNFVRNKFDPFFEKRARQVFHFGYIEVKISMVESHNSMYGR
jgi:hypothetical protein